MARRSRENRREIPGYDENRPSRDERKKQHRQVRHSTHQMLHMVDDPEEVMGLPEVRRTRQADTPLGDVTQHEPERRRYKIWKTKFWKRRDDYRNLKSEIDSNWPVITTEQLRED
jgi:hypothetical protein